MMVLKESLMLTRLKKKGGLTSDVNEKGSLKIKTGGQ